MKGLPIIVSVLLLTGLLLGAGCTQAGTGATPPSSPAAAPDLSTCALTAADAPPNFTVTESRAKTPGEVGNLAQSLGWSGGYVVKFTGPQDSPMGATEITQTITTYPAARMSEIAALVETNDRADNELTFTTLPSPGLGDSSSAFSGKAIGQIVVRPDTGNPLITTSAKGSFKQDMAEIIFAKGSTLEVFRMTGPDASITTLQGLAEKAYARIP
jgi:hypothetical protein